MGEVVNGAYVRIQSGYARLLPSEKRIADIVLQDTEAFASLSISQLAEMAQTSVATVNRFCKRLGYKGFKDFRVSAIRDAHTTVVQTLIPPVPSMEAGAGTKEEVVRDICRSNAQACMDTELLLDMATLDKAVALMCTQKRIILIGEGAVSAVIQDLYQKLLRVGIFATCSSDQRYQKMQIGLCGPDDLVIAIDLTGSKRATVEMAANAVENQAQVITICNTIGSTLSKVGGLNLYGPGQAGSHITATLAPRIALLCIVDCLFTLLVRELGDSILDNIKKTNKVITDDWIE